MKFCPNYSTSFVATNKSDKLVYKARCKRWSCPYCAKVNQRVWRARIMGEVEKTPKHKKWFFWTITLPPRVHKQGMVKSLHYWREKWDKFMKRIRRDLGKIRYIRVFEPHKSGILHVHMLTDKAYGDLKRIEEGEKVIHTSEKLMKHLKDLKLGYRHDIKPIITEDEKENGVARNVSAYVTKYMTKELQGKIRQDLSDAGMSRVRMIQTSGKWFNQEKKVAQLSWDNRALTLTEVLYGKSGGQSIDISKDKVITTDDFYDYEHYPNKISDLIDIVDDGYD